MVGTKAGYKEVRKTVARRPPDAGRFFVWPGVAATCWSAAGRGDWLPWSQDNDGSRRGGRRGVTGSGRGRADPARYVPAEPVRLAVAGLRVHEHQRGGLGVAPEFIPLSSVAPVLRASTPVAVASQTEGRSSEL